MPFNISNASSQEAGAVGLSRPGTIFIWLVVSAIVAPASIILHELGHFLVAAAFNFPDLVLHYGSVSHSAAEQSFPLWQLSLQAAAGPLVTILIAAICCLYVARRGPNLLAIATGIVAPIRFLMGIYFLGLTILIWFTGGRIGGSNFDEFNVAETSGLPLWLLLFLELLVLAGTWWFLAKSLPRARRLLILASVSAGMIVGIALWFSLLGPFLLP